MRKFSPWLAFIAVVLCGLPTALLGAQPPTINDIDFSPSDTPLTTEVLTLTVVAKSPDNLQLKITWSFGDGVEGASGTTVTHTFAAAGDYTVTVTVSDGVNPNVTKTIHIQAIAPPAAGSLPGVNQGEKQENPDTGGSCTVVSSVNGVVELLINQAPLNAVTSSIATDFGDGGRIVNGPHPRHMYAAPGIYIATSTIKDESSGSMIAQIRKTLEISSADVNPNGGTTAPAVSGLSQPQTHAIAVLALSGKFNLNADNKIDTASTTFVVELPAGLHPQQRHDITLSVGNVVETVSLNAKGSGVGSSRYKKVKVVWPKTFSGATSLGQSATVSVVLASANLVDAGFDTEGVSNLKKRVQTSIQVGMLLEGIAWSGAGSTTLKVSKNGDMVTMSTK